MDILKVPASHGLKWLLQGFVLLRRHFFIWLAFVLILFALLFVAVRVSYASPLLAMLASILFCLLTPVFLGGLMIGARVVEKGDELEIAHLFAGFRANTANLLATGGALLVGNFVINWIVYGIGGPAMAQFAQAQAQNVDPAVLAQAMGPVMLALMVGLALSVPLAMALWFAPPLIVFRSEKPAQALRLSFQGCRKNMAPFLVYGLVVLALMIALMVMLVVLFNPKTPAAGIGVVILLFLPTTLLVLPSIYTSYRDIFADVPAVASAPEPPPPAQ